MSVKLNTMSSHSIRNLNTGNFRKSNSHWDPQDLSEFFYKALPLKKEYDEKLQTIGRMLGMKKERTSYAYEPLCILQTLIDLMLIFQQPEFMEIGKYVSQYVTRREYEISNMDIDINEFVNNKMGVDYWGLIAVIKRKGNQILTVDEHRISGLIDDYENFNSLVKIYNLKLNIDYYEGNSSLLSIDTALFILNDTIREVTLNPKKFWYRRWNEEVAFLDMLAEVRMFLLECNSRFKILLKEEKEMYCDNH